MRPNILWRDWDIYYLFAGVLPDFVLAFTFFTSLSYAVLGKRFGLQRPAIAMSASIGLALAIGLVWWERAVGLSIRDLGPLAIGFAILVLALVVYQAIRQIGGSWAGAGIGLGVSILMARWLELGLPIAPEILQIIIMVALITGILALISSTRNRAVPYQPVSMPEVCHDMSDLYRNQGLSKRLSKKLRNLGRRTDTLNQHPREATDLLVQLRRILPAQGYLTSKMANLRAKAHRMRNGHIARLEETRHAFAKLPAAAKKKASMELDAQYKKIIGIDTRLERLDKAVAENERRIIELTDKARQYTAQYDHRHAGDCLRAAEKLQHHNSRLIRLIKHTEGKLSAVAKKVAAQAKEVDKK